MTEQSGVAMAVVSSILGGTALAVTRYLAGEADPITLAVLRWAIGFCCTLPVTVALLATQLVGEPITVNLVIGMGAVLAGIWLATTKVGEIGQR